MEYIIDHIPFSPTKRPGIKITPLYITIHSTANPHSTAKNERAWLTNPLNQRSASWHIVVDENNAIEAIPLDEMAYHAGTLDGNRESIGIELAESGDREKVLKNAVELTAKLLHERGWGTDRLVRHYDWSGKICPIIFADNNWALWHQFVRDVSKQLEILKNLEQKGMETMEIRYATLKETPNWAKPTLEKLIKKGYLLGDEKSTLDLSMDMIRMFVINDRAGLYDR